MRFNLAEKTEEPLLLNSPLDYQAGTELPGSADNPTLTRCEPRRVNDNHVCGIVERRMHSKERGCA